MKVFKIFFLISLMVCSGALAQNITNPVIPCVADAGVLRYAGKYYLGGVSTYGDFFVSNDLVHWTKRIHVFDLDNDWTRGSGAKNNQVHADDIVYFNGKFHLLFSVNYWGKDKNIVHIAHSVADTPEGPFTEVKKDSWFENRIDPMTFLDDNGKLYLYMVKFTEGNVIWGRALSADFQFIGAPIQQFSSIPGTWETLDSRVVEGPFTIKYRGRYYMMYNANATYPEYGNYCLGVCEADFPLAFGNGGKYSYPVVGPNIEKLRDSVDLLRYGSDSYSPVNLQSDIINFAVQRSIHGKLILYVHQLGGMKILLNNRQVYVNSHSDYQLVHLDASTLYKGLNQIRVERAGDKSRLCDIALFDVKNNLVDDDLYVTPGQPNIVKGPNGFEWWLVYMANKNGEARGQYIDRVHFINSKLSVDGITGVHTQGYHPMPAKPYYIGTSIDTLCHSDTYLVEVTLRNKKANESGFVFTDKRGTSIEIGVDCSHQQYFLRHRNGAGISTLKEGKLPVFFDKHVAHTWRMERNGQRLALWVDGILLINHEVIDSWMAGLPTDNIRLMGDATDYLVENVINTLGWDEWGENFSGWENKDRSICRLSAEPDGLCLPSGSEISLFKGPAALKYEYTAQFANDSNGDGCYGVYASYADGKNYTKIAVNAATHSLEIEQCMKGKRNTSTISLAIMKDCYPDFKYSDMIEKQYLFPNDAIINAIRLYRHDADSTALFINDMAALFQIDYLKGDKWISLPAQSVSESGHPAWQQLCFDPVCTRALRFINKNPEDTHRHLYKIKVNNLFSAAYQIRIARDGTKLHVFVNDKEIASPNVGNRSGRVGLFSDGRSTIHIRDVLYYQNK